MSQRYFDDQGRSLPLGKEVGIGGEGRLVEIIGQADCVAKLYNDAPDAELEQKLRIMIDMNNPKLRQFCAWPQQLIRSGAPNGPVAGFVMPYFRDAVQLKDLLTPSDRIFHFPQLNWKDLVQLAENLAKAVAIPHSFGLVIGDLHPENIMVNQTARPLLIDCDSWQIPSPHKVFRRQVLREDFTPPELQGVDFSKIDGTPNHDAFALAMMIFNCLFLGQNPFAGTYGGKGPDDLSTAIKEHRYAYAQNASRRKIQPRIDSLNPAELTPPLAVMFEKAFMRVKNRPTATEWYNALREFRRTLRPCTVNKRHFHQRKQRKCRLCEFESRFLRLTFPEIAAQAVVDSNAAWTLPPTCQQLSQTIMPNVSFPIAAGAKAVPALSSRVEKSIDVELRLAQCFLGGYAFCITCVLLHLILPIPAAITLALFVVLVVYVLVSPAQRERRRRRKAARNAEYQAHKEEKALQKFLKTAAVQIPDLNRVTSVRQDLENSYQTYLTYHQNQRKRFEERSEKEYLKQHAISYLRIPGLSKSAMTELALRGIVTAADVRADKVDRITSINDRQRTLVLNWRMRINAAYQPPAYKSILTANGFAQEFELYQDRLPREQFINDVINTVLSGVNSVQTQTQQAVAQIQSLRTQAEIDAELATIIRKKFWVPLTQPSAYSMAMLALAILCAPACKFAIRHWESRQSLTVANSEIPPVDVIPIEYSVPAPSPVPASEIRMKPEWPKVPSASEASERESSSSEDMATVPMPNDLPAATTLPPIDIYIVDDSNRETGPEVQDPLARYEKAYKLFEQDLRADGTQELYMAILESGGETPKAVFERFENKQGRARRAFEAARVIIEGEIRKKAAEEKEGMRSGNQ